MVWMRTSNSTRRDKSIQLSLQATVVRIQKLGGITAVKVPSDLGSRPSRIKTSLRRGKCKFT